MYEKGFVTWINQNAFTHLNNNILNLMFKAWQAGFLASRTMENQSCEINVETETEIETETEKEKNWIKEYKEWLTEKIR